MGLVKDTLAIFKKRDLVVRDIQKEAEGIYTFRFQKPNDLIWEPGQYGLFAITHRKIKNGTKPFSIASVPDEQVVALTTRIGEQPSEFKRALLELTPGMSVKMSGPAGAFALPEDAPALLVADGIGITPIRAILKGAHAAGRTRQHPPIQVLYLDRDNTGLYREELEATANRAVTLTSPDSSEALHGRIASFISAHSNSATYLIAGPKPGVDAIAADVQQQGISKKKIKKDAFYGYA
ncbi:FAD-dependent oxidoreductase [Paenibacillus sp. IB182496]|uniref:FAD-dependent oxidoreductase n=1 Tax=Paenibacillus sabuli TaxID=2772509 RepID=A0A927BT49_9BACL|nr:FAD-dependent oxidoreductase [Paenibacillus sabuli]MBD2845421.1 FAD-dependent oxidoreductase [Paenibacillus sabuli]